MTPVYNEFNRVQVNSPVPIGGSEPARAQMEAQDALGKAIFDLGNVLDNVKEDKEQYKIQARIAADQYEKGLLYNHQRERVGGNMADPTGVATSENILESTKPLKNDLTSNMDPRVRMYFEEYAADAEKKHIPAFLETGAVGNQNKLKNQLNEAFANINEKARLDPTALPAYLLEASVLAEESTQIPNSAKDTVTREKSASIVKSVADMYKDQQQFGQAKNVLLTHRTYFDNDKLDQELADIDKRNLEAVNISYTTQKRNIELAQEILKEKDKEASNDYTQKIAAAKNNSILLKQIDLQIAQDPRLTSESRNALTRSKQVFSEVSDDDYQFRFMDRLIKTGDFKKAEEILIKDRQSGSVLGNVSFDRATKLQNMLKEMKEQQAKNPAMQTLIKQGLDEIASYGKISMVLDPITGMQKPQVDQANERAQTQYLLNINRTIMNGGTITPEYINKQIQDSIGAFGKTRTINLPGVSPTEMDTSDKIATKQKELAKKLLDAQKNGRITPELLKTSKEQFRALEGQRQRLQKTESKKIEPGPAQGGTKLFDE